MFSLQEAIQTIHTTYFYKVIRIIRMHKVNLGHRWKQELALNWIPCWNKDELFLLFSPSSPPRWKIHQPSVFCFFSPCAIPSLLTWPKPRPGIMMLWGWQSKRPMTIDGRFRRSPVRWMPSKELWVCSFCAVLWARVQVLDHSATYIL